MTVLRDFIDEIGRELDARGDKALAPHHWLGFVKLLGDLRLVGSNDHVEEVGQSKRGVDVQASSACGSDAHAGRRRRPDVYRGFHGFVGCDLVTEVLGVPKMHSRFVVKHAKDRTPLKRLAGFGELG